jgi:hypothetical protein
MPPQAAPPLCVQAIWLNYSEEETKTADVFFGHSTV